MDPVYIIGLYLSFRHETMRKYLRHDKRIKRNDSLSQETVKAVHTYYDEQSRCIPDKKANGRRILSATTKSLYQQFKQKNVSNLSLSKFQKLRPAHILPVANHRFRTCLCEVCLNLGYKARVLQSLGAEIKNKNELLNVSLCPKENSNENHDQQNAASTPQQNKDYHQPKCLMRECSNCGVNKVEEIVLSLVPNPQTQNVKWKHWETITPSPNVKRKAQLEKSDTVSHFMDEMKNELQTFGFHILAAQWQQNQQRLLASKIPNSSVLTIQDFAENYRHVCQDEIASAYFNYTQTALLTSVSFYECLKCGQPVQESTVFLTNDLLHDAYLVKTANELQHQKWKVDGIEFEKQIFFSDGCSAQFKSKVPFHLLKVGSERAYFGSQHGKSICDSLGGVVKQAATRQVASGERVISSTHDLYKFCQESLTLNEECSQKLHKKRNFIFIDKTDVKRPQLEEKLISVPGTRKFHQVVKVRENVIKARNLACYCKNCLSGGGSCENLEFTGPWHEFSLVNEGSKGTKAKKKQKQKEKGNQTVLSDQYDELRKTLSTSKGRAQRAFADQLKFEEISSPHLNMLSCKAIIDGTANDLMPDDIDHLEGLQFPVVVTGDGNCLPRCGSLVAYLKEDNHEEIRLRIAVEMICNKESYLDKSYLSRGLPDNEGLAPQTVALYSSQFFGEKLTKASVRKIFEKEISEVLQKNSFMGLWQIFALSSVLKRPIVSVYPKRGNPNVRRDMHRIILPREQQIDQPVGIMWSSARGDMTKEHWVPNHFCLLLGAFPTR